MVYPNISQWKSIKKLFTVIPKVNPILTDCDSNHDDPKVGMINMITKPTCLRAEPLPRQDLPGSRSRSLWWWCYNLELSLLAASHQLSHMVNPLLTDRPCLWNISCYFTLCYFMFYLFVYWFIDFYILQLLYIYMVLYIYIIISYHDISYHIISYHIMYIP